MSFASRCPRTLTSCIVRIVCLCVYVCFFSGQSTPAVASTPIHLPVSSLPRRSGQVDGGDGARQGNIAVRRWHGLPLVLRVGGEAARRKHGLGWSQHVRNDYSALGVLVPWRPIALRSGHGEEAREFGKRLNMGPFFVVDFLVFRPKG